jgi:hypothetical protein
MHFWEKRVGVVYGRYQEAGREEKLIRERCPLCSDVRWKIFNIKFSAIFFQKIFRFLKSSLNISFFNLFLVALGLRGCYTY